MAGLRVGAVVDENDTLVDTASDLGSRIRMSLDYLCNNSTNLPEVLVHLLSNSLLSQRESQVIENQLSDYDSFRQLFTLLIPKVRHGDNAQHFVNAFQKSGNEHILEELKSAAVITDFASSPTTPVTSSRSIRFNVREPVPSFVGRNNFLCDLHRRNLQHLQNHPTDANVPTTSTIISRICVITGLGGIGKSETIRKYIHSYGHCYQHVVWIDAEEHNTAEDQFSKVAQQELKLSPKDFEFDNKAMDFDVLLKDIYDRLCTKHTLLVLDNAESLHDSDPKRPGVARFLPKCLSPTHLKLVVLITSRQIDWPDLHNMPLPILTPQESSEFLFRQLNLTESDVNAKHAVTMSDIFEGLPLALQAAVAVIRQEFKRNSLMGNDVYTIQDLLSDYTQGKREVLKKRPLSSPDTQPLMFLWKVSLDKIRQQPHGHLATEILNVLAHLSPTNIPKELLFFIFNSEDSVDSVTDAVGLLVDYSFVRNFHTHFSIHRVLQDVTLAHLNTITEQHSQNWLMSFWTLLGSWRRSSSTPFLTRITTALRKYWPTVPKSSEVYDAVHDNLVHVTMSHVLPKAQNQSETDLHFIEFLEFVLKEIKDTRWVEAEKCCRVLITYFTKSTLDSHSASFFKSPQFKKVQRLRWKLVWILRETGRHKEALDICQVSLSFLNSLKNQKDVISEILDTKHNLAWILLSQGEYEEAIKLFSSVSDLRSKLHGPTHKSTMHTKNNLAVAFNNTGRLSEAKTLYAEVLEVRMKDPGHLHLDTLATKHNMATLLKEEGRYDEALEMLREVVEVQESELGPLHAHTLASKSCMADVLAKQGKDEDVLRLYAHVISSYAKASAASHPRCLKIKSSMALILGKQDRLNEAKEMLCQVLDIQERLLGSSHEDTLTTKHNLASVLEKQGKDAGTLKLYEEVLQLKTKQLGQMNPDTLQTNHNIGCLHLKMGNFEKAESIAKEVLSASQTTLPSDHADCKDAEDFYEKARLQNNRSTH